MRPFWVSTVGILAVQFTALVLYSAYLYRHFDLTDDFGTYAQAWWLIGHGHVNPVDTIQVPMYSFWRSHFELAMWPIAMLGRVWPHAIQLLWLQDLAIVATEWFTMLWVARICVERFPTHRSLAAVAALGALVLNPWWYQAASFDVHFEVLGLPFVVWSAYSLWRGHTRTCLIVAGVALLFGDVVTISILCVALAGVMSHRVRRTVGLRTPLLLGAASLVWIGLITLLGGNMGSGIVTNYGYLVGAHPAASSASVLAKLVLHPWPALKQLFDRRAAMARVLASAGLLGVVAPWGLMVAIGTLGPAALNVNPAFLSPTIAFQTIAVIPFVLVGTVMVLVWIGLGRSQSGNEPGRDRPLRARGSRSVGALGLASALAVLSLVQNVPLLSSLRSDWWKVNTPAAAVLRTALPMVPADAEAIISQGVIGRFANRRYLYPLLASPQAFPVHTREVVFVIVPSQGLESISESAAQATISSVTARPHTRVILDRGGVVVISWHPAPGVTGIVLP